VDVSMAWEASRDSSVGKRLVTDWTVPESNPGGGEIFPSRPDLPWAHRVSFPGVKWIVDQPPPSSAEVKERVDLVTALPLNNY
jgi:hypothetical protein